jgi:hypothetical protein
MRFASITFFFISLFLISTAHAQIPYYINGAADTLYFPVSIEAGTSAYYIIEKTPGYSPDGSQVFDSFDSFETLSGWTTPATYSPLLLSTNHKVSGTYAAMDDGLNKRVMERTDRNYNNKVYEIEFYDDEILSTSQGIFRRNVDGVFTGIGVSNNLNYLYRYGASWTASSIPRTQGWHTLRIDFTGTTGKFYVDGVYINSFSYTNVDTIMAVGDYWNTGTETEEWFDDLRIRQYTANQPTYTITDMGDWYKVELSSSVTLTDYTMTIPADEFGITSSADSVLVDLYSIDVIIYDESTGSEITPVSGSVTIYSENIAYTGTVVGNKTSFIIYDLDENLILSASKDGYYSRTEVLLKSNIDHRNSIYLPSEAETVIFDRFSIIDNTFTYNYADIILVLEKPMPTGTKSVYSSYMDFTGSTSTYLISTDQYILYLITPNATYNYGWLTPDPDGQINININSLTFDTADEWINYTYDESNTGVSFLYNSSKTVDVAYMIVNRDGVEDYNVSASTTSGQFTYAISEDGIYTVEIKVLTEDNHEFLRNSVIQVGSGKTIDPFPEEYTLALKSVVVAFIIVVGMLASSSYRADLSCMYGAAVYAFAVYQDWCIGNIYTVSIVGIIAVAAIVKFQRKHDRSA